MLDVETNQLCLNALSELTGPKLTLATYKRNLKMAHVPTEEAVNSIYF